MPVVDEFISKYIYRSEPYDAKEARELLPYVETLRELSDWAIFDTNHRELRSWLLTFRGRMKTFATALEFTDKYGLELYSSY